MNMLSGVELVDELETYRQMWSSFHRRRWLVTFIGSVLGLAMLWFGSSNRSDLWCLSSRMIGSLVTVLSPVYGARFAGTLPVRTKGSSLEIVSVSLRELEPTVDWMATANGPLSPAQVSLPRGVLEALTPSERRFAAFQEGIRAKSASDFTAFMFGLGFTAALLGFVLCILVGAHHSGLAIAALASSGFLSLSLLSSAALRVRWVDRRAIKAAGPREAAVSFISKQLEFSCDWWERWALIFRLKGLGAGR